MTEKSVKAEERCIHGVFFSVVSITMQNLGTESSDCSQTMVDCLLLSYVGRLKSKHLHVFEIVSKEEEKKM